MSRLGSLTGKLIVLTTGEGAARVLGIFTFAVLARAMGVSGFGVFSFGLSLAMILECFMDLGQAAQVGIRVADDSVDGLRNHPMAATNKILICLLYTSDAADE